MTLTPKETSLLKDLKEQENLCIEKYRRYAAQACDEQLKCLFEKLEQNENAHLNTLNQLSSGTVPQGSGQGNTQNAGQGNAQGAGQQSPSQAAWQASGKTCSQADRQADNYLCADALSNEKHVSAEYDTSIFEFRDAAVRNVLNQIQSQEQQHGEQIYQYMAANNMYN